ncbi:hypothetical protein D3C87_1818570 [compost metagenome]
MAEAYEIHTHIFHHLHFLTDHSFCHGCSHSGMVFVAVRSPEQQTLSVQQEGAFFNELKIAETDLLCMDMSNTL